MVMEPTDFRHGDHLAPVWSVDRARFRTIQRQGQKGPPLVIIGEEVGQDALQMLLVQDEGSWDNKPL